MSGPEELRKTYEAVLSMELTPDTVDVYATTALAGIISVVEAAKYDYLVSHYEQPVESDLVLEDAALDHLGLPDIASTLDHISQIAAGLEAIDDRITGIERSGEIIVPPDLPDRPMSGPGGGGFERKRIPRLKTLLFLLKEEFGFDVHDEAVVRIQQGEAPDDIFRNLPYFLVEISELDRSVYVCDEDRNATFVFVTSLLEEQGISAERRLRLGKEEMAALIQGNGNIGRRVRYSKNFVNNIVGNLTGPMVQNDRDYSRRNEPRPSYLVPPAPDDVESVAKIARRLKLGHKAVDAVVSEMLDSLGYAPEYSFKSFPARGYDRSQVSIIEGVLADRGYIAPEPPEGVVGWTQFARDLHFSRPAELVKIVEPIKETLGELKVYRWGRSRSRRAVGLDVEQQETIITYLRENDLVRFPKLPDDKKSLRNIARETGVDEGILDTIVVAIKDDLGEVETYSIGTLNGGGYDKDQVAVIKAALKDRKLLLPLATNDIVSRNAFAEGLGIHPSRVEKVEAELDSQLGNVKRYRFPRHAAHGYNPQQRAILTEYLTNKGELEQLERIPPDRVPTPIIAAELGVTSDTIRRAVSRLGDSIGVINRYRLNRGGEGIGFDADQKAMIEEYVRTKSRAKVKNSDS